MDDTTPQVDPRQRAAALRRKQELAAWLALASIWQDEYDEINDFLAFLDSLEQEKNVQPD